MNLKTFKKYLLALASIVSIVLGAYVPSATAEEIIITENGSGTSNDAVVTQTQNTNVIQTNTTDVNNNITTTSNTGGNTASDNTGGATSILTGDSSTSANVSNTGNVNVANVGACDCPITNSAIISGNGANSSNTINNNYVNNIDVSTNNLANVTNNLTIDANTGDNTADDNNGNVRIATGNVTAKISLLSALNFSKIKLSYGGNVDRLLKIAGNGVSSVNTINNVEINNVNVSENNVANFLNDILATLNTGGNSASSNIGDVDIKTGDVWTEIKVKNLANINEVIIDCGCREKPGEEKPPILPPGITTTPPSSVSGGGAPTTQPAVQAAIIAAALGEILPTTGGNWLFFALIANILMFLFGAYLRLRSGRSPGLVFAR